MEQLLTGNDYRAAQDTRNLRHYQLPLRGKNINPMIDAATPLLGMLLRLSKMDSQPLPEKLYQQVVADIQSIEQLLQTQGYEPGAIVSFRYVLCTFIDEVALGQGWNSENGWLKQSLLVHFHNETWGGEKVYVLLERVMSEPKRYHDLMMFIYLCFCLGFRGRYKVSSPQNDEFDRIFRRLYNTIAPMQGDPPVPLLYRGDSSERPRYQLHWRLTIRQLLTAGAIMLLLIYCFYALRLSLQTQDILQQLNGLLSGGAR